MWKPQINAILWNTSKFVFRRYKVYLLLAANQLCIATHEYRIAWLFWYQELIVVKALSQFCRLRAALFLEQCFNHIGIAITFKTLSANLSNNYTSSRRFSTLVLMQKA